MKPPEHSSDLDWARVEEIFAAALEWTAPARDSFLDAECGSDSELRAEVDSLLASHAESAWLFDAAPAEAKRETIGAYRIVRELGRGGMGVVYLAEQSVDSFQRKVAIKVVRPGLETRVFLDRFRREQHILATLDHPNIARMIDAGATDDGLPYLVMEYVDGIAIDAFCDQRRLSLPQRIELFAKVCDAVSEAHRHLIIHRDLKPGNILVTAAGEAKLLDFGLGKLLDAGGEVRETTELRMMTLRFASPEQIRAQPLSTASDVYSLGIILYLLLTGEHPIRTEPSDMLAFATAVAEEQPMSLARHFDSSGGASVAKRAADRAETPARLTKLLAGDLENILQLALKKNPRERYSSASDLAADLRRHLRGDPVTAHPDSLAYRIGKLVRRNRAAVAAAALAIVSLGVGLGVSIWQTRVALQQANKAAAINSFLQRMLSAANPADQGRSVTVAQVLERAAPLMEKELAGQPEVQAEIRATIGATYQGLGMNAEAEPLLRAALRQIEQLQGKREPSYATVLLELANVQEAKGDLVSAVASESEALQLRRQLFREPDKGIAMALAQLGATQIQQGNLEQALVSLQNSFQMLQQLQLDHDVHAGKVMNDLGVALGTMGRVQEAIQWHRRALVVMRKEYSPGSYEIGQVAGSLAGILPFDSPEATALFQEAIRIKRQVLGNDHPDLAWSLYNFAFSLEEIGKISEALKLCDEILSHRGIALPEENPMVAATLLLQAKCYLKKSQFPLANTAVADCLRLRRKTLPAGHWLLLAAESVQGQILLASGQRTQAIPLLRDSYESLREKLGPEHPQTRLAKARLEKVDHP